MDKLKTQFFQRLQWMEVIKRHYIIHGAFWLEMRRRHHIEPTKSGAMNKLKCCCCRCCRMCVYVLLFIFQKCDDISLIFVLSFVQCLVIWVSAIDITNGAFAWNAMCHRFEWRSERANNFKYLRIKLFTSYLIIQFFIAEPKRKAAPTIFQME